MGGPSGSPIFFSDPPFPLIAILDVRYDPSMSTLAEIEAAVDALPTKEKQELLIFLAARLRADGQALPEPRRFSREQMASWIAEDEEDMRGLRTT